MVELQIRIVCMVFSGASALANTEASPYNISTITPVTLNVDKHFCCCRSVFVHISSVLTGNVSLAVSQGHSGPAEL